MKMNARQIRQDLSVFRLFLLCVCFISEQIFPQGSIR